MIKTQEIKHNRLKKIVDDYNEIQNWLVKHKRVLEILKKDHELLTGKPPYKINFAVDFHEIHQMVFPMGSERGIKEIKDSEKGDWVRKKVLSQTGRICLFYGIDTVPVPVLLPPYRNELEDLLFWLKAEYKSAVRQYHLLSELKHSIQTALQEEGIEFKIRGKQFKISDENYAKIIEFIKNHFFQLNFLLMGGYTEKLSILRSLFSDMRIEMVSDRWSEYSGYINSEIKKVPDAWYGFIREFRKENQPDSQHRERDIRRANSRDILALHLIKALNKKLKAQNKKEIVLLVSDAEIFTSLLNSKLYDNRKDNTIGGLVETATGEKIEILRTTDVFHTYLIIKNEREELKDHYKQEFGANPTSQINMVALINVRNDLQKIKLIERFKIEIDRIIGFCNKNGCDCQNLGSCQYEDICLTSEKVIKKFQEDRKSQESLALAEKFDIYAKIYKHYQQVVGFDEGVNQILRLLQDDEKIGDIINKKLEEIREHINKGFEKLTLSAIYTRESVPKVIKIPRGNSFRIKTYEKDIDEIIRKIQKSIRQNDQENFSLYFSDLKNKKNRLDKTKSLEYLLSSLISAAYEKYDLSLYFLERGLIFTGVKAHLYRELKYLEAIIYCNDKKYDEALTLCKELVEKFESDPRFPYFCGYIILTGRDDDELEEYSEDDAVKYCKEALAIFMKTGDDDADLDLYILNNLIYGLANIGTLDAIEEAEQDIIELKRCSKPEYDWGFHIWHTVGYVFFRKAELLKERNEDFTEIICKAIENFKTADKKANGVNPIIKRDIEKAKEMLNGLNL
jgi:hypothetical protein